MTRSEIRECAFILLFQKEFSDDDITQIAQDSTESFGLETDKSALSLANGVFKNKVQIDETISSYSKTRSLKRIAKIILTILRIAVYEMDCLENIPPKVAINEAIELSKKYGTESDSKFISGLLGNHYREVHGG